LWSIPVPIPITLRYVLVYAFETPRGPYLVDAGWASDDAFDALGGGLRRAGFEPADVRGVMVTHVHDDHYPLAGRVRQLSDA
jgi:glyoxylase-like metal-dependent hydrolase (beta-lactamase superfamily II)